MSSGTPILATMGAGTIFGAALAASGVYSPHIIISQMQVQDFYMLQTFLTASAISAVAFVAAKRLGISQCAPRSASTFGWFHKYDGNIIGGLLLGCGMALSGACPGTVLVQISTGIRSGYMALAGGIFGGVLYTQLAPYLRQATQKPALSSATSIGEVKNNDSQEHLTIYQYYSIKESHAVLIYEIFCLTVILSAMYLKSGDTYVLIHPIVGGLVIGVGQVASLLLTGNAVGVSTAYEQLGNLISYYLLNQEREAKYPTLTSVPFSVGILIGGAVLGWITPLSIPRGHLSISMTRAVVGGLMIVLGARVAGGCTSGHGVSGMSTLSMSSIITVTSICVGGIGAAAFI